MESREVHAGGLKLHVCTHPCVYQPSDDTVAAVEALTQAASRGLTARSVADVGTGTGILALAAAKVLHPSRLLAVDWSPYAVEAAKCTLREVPGSLVARCNGLSCLRGVDLLLSNPPYLDVDDRRLSRGECEEWLYTSWGPGGLLLDVAENGPRLARSILVVYSTLSPINPEERLAGMGYRVLARVERRFFMEAIRAVVMVRGAR